MHHCHCPALSAVCLVDAEELALLDHCWDRLAEMGHQMAVFGILQSGEQQIVRHVCKQAIVATLCDLSEFATLAHQCNLGNLLSSQRLKHQAVTASAAKKL